MSDSIQKRLTKLEAAQEKPADNWDMAALSDEELTRLRAIRSQHNPAGPTPDLTEDDQIFLADVRRKCVKSV